MIEWFDAPQYNRDKIGLEYVTITKRSGHINIGQTFYDNNSLDRFKYARLGYDKINNIIVIKLNHEQGKSEYKISYVRNNKQPNIYSKSFLDFHNIDYTETRSHSVKWDESEQLITINLNDIM